MKRLILGIVVFILSVAFTHPCLGEGPSYNFGFSQMGKTYNWNHSLRFNKEIGTRLSLSGSSKLSSRLIKSTREKNRWQDSNRAQFSLSYPYSEKITLSVSSSASKSSDNLYSKEPVLTRSLSAVITYKPFPLLSFSQSLGQAFDRRQGRSGDSGLNYSLNASVKPKLPDFLNLNFQFRKSGNTLRRRSLNNNLSASLSYHPNSASEIRLSLSQGRNEQGYYTTVGGKDTLFVRRNRSSNIKTHLKSQLREGLSVGCELGYSYSQVRDPANYVKESPKYGTDNETTNFDFTITLAAKPFGADFNSKLSFQRDNSDYRRFSLDRKNRSLSLTSSLGFDVTPKVSLSFSGLVAKYSMDTPDPEEVSDRDDFKSSFRVNYVHKLRDDFKLNVSASTDQNHTVNLDSERSANNHWSRRYSLNPRIEYQPSSRVRLSQTYTLSANYTEYDFDQLLNPNNPESNVTRMFSANNSFSFKLFPALSLNASYNLQARDYGKFYPDKSEAVVENSQNHSLTFSLSYRRGRISVSPEYTWSTRRSWKHTQRKTPPWESSSRVFTLNLAWRQLSVVGVRSVRKSGKRKPYVTDTISVRYSHTF